MQREECYEKSFILLKLMDIGIVVDEKNINGLCDRRYGYKKCVNTG